MSGVILEAHRLRANSWFLDEVALPDDSQALLLTLCAEWPDLTKFWERLTEHITHCWQADLDGRTMSVLGHALGQGVRAVERSHTVRSEEHFGILMNEVLFVVSAFLAGHVAVAGPENIWTADQPETFGAYLARIDQSLLAVLRQPTFRQRRGEIAQFLFYHLLEPRVRAIVWSAVEPAMGPPGGRLR